MATRDYVVRFPRDVTVVSACEDVRCEAWQFGWETYVDEAANLGRAQADYIRHQSGRTFTELRTAAGGTVFRFASGQRCFAEHRTRPSSFFADGRRVPDLAAWVGDLDDHVNRLEAQAKKG